MANQRTSVKKLTGSELNPKPGITTSIDTAPWESSDSLLILSPVYDDWDSALILLGQIDHQLSKAGMKAKMLFIDDGSNSLPVWEEVDLQLEAIERAVVLPLRRNLGHQRAIAIGLAYAERHFRGRAVLIMDSDGQDAPNDIPRLAAKLVETAGKKVIFAERTRRIERGSFQVLYHIYRLIHRVLTGISVRVGNFSIVPGSLLRRLVVVSELWNHYAAAVFASNIPYEAIPTVRSDRIAGNSKMNFVSLVGHGLNAISVHSERLAVRLLAGVVFAVLFSVLAMVVLLGLRLATEIAIPGWTSAVGLAIIVLIAQLMTLVIAFVFMILHRRSGSAFLPSRDYEYYVDDAFDIIHVCVDQPAVKKRGA